MASDVTHVPETEDEAAGAASAGVSAPRQIDSFREYVLINLRGGAISLTVTVIQIFAFVVFISVVVSLSAEKLRTLLWWGLPILGVLWILFFLSLNVMGRFVQHYLKARERGDEYTLDQIAVLQRKLVNFPYWIAVSAMIAYIVAILIAWGALPYYFGIEKRALVIGLFGGLFAGTINMPVAAFSGMATFRRLLQDVSTWIPGSRRGGLLGARMTLRTKQYLMYFTIVGAYLAYIALMSYALMMRVLQTGGDFGTGPGEPVLSVFALWFPHWSVSNVLVATYLSMILSALVLTLYVSTLSANELTFAVEELSKTAKSIAEGEMGAHAALITNDEMGELAENLNHMSTALAVRDRALRNIITQVKDASKHVHGASDEIAGIIAEQTAGATEQATSVRELSATSEQIVETARQIADTTTASDEVLDKILQVSGDGRQGVARTLEGIAQVRNRVDSIAHSLIAVGEESQRASNIVNIIEEISERTNLLALNAAIESRGAGESGSRFQVVAQEIRRLAESTKDATAKIKAIIEGIQASTASSIMHTEEGMKAAQANQELIQDVGTRLQDILDMVEQIAGRSKDIFQTTQEQKTSLEQIAGTVGHLSTAAEQIAKGYGDTEGLIRDLTRMAESLNDLVRSAELRDGAQ